MARTLNAEQLLPLVRTLADGRWHSGAALARTAGITRAGLAKRVQRLAAWGLEVETRPGRGCRLAQPLELLDAELIRGAIPASLRPRIRIRTVALTDSTNTQLLEADAGDDPQALLAEYQSAGRGRQGRSWHSPFGSNLYLSLAWSFPQWPPALTALPLATGVATARALQACGVHDVRLKWPNDLWRTGAKLGGILIEQRGEAGGQCRVVIGLGLNVSMRRTGAGAITQPWTTVAEALGGMPSRNALAARVLEAWVVMLDAFAARGFAPFRDDWHALDLLHDRPVVVRRADGDTGGIARGVDESGALLLEQGDQRHRLLSGDVSLRPAP